MADRLPLHAPAWLMWAGAVVVIGSVTRNPVYLLLMMLWIGLVSLALTLGRQEHEMPPVPLSPWRFGLVVIAVSALFNGLTVHVGSTVLLRLPARWPLIGGPVTAEALLYGALNGVVISAFLAAFLLVNRAVAVRDLVRLIPRAYYPVAVVISIAITFVPTTLRRFQAIREAQAIRGHRVRGVRSWLPLFVPLLTGGMEQALQLSEAMMARGFAGAADDGNSARLQGALLGGLGLTVAGWLLRLLSTQALAGALMMIGGIALIGFGLWRAGRRHPHTVYRPRRQRAADWLVGGAALATTLLFLVDLPGLERQSLFYSPYPTLSWPDFSIIYGAATWGLLAPAVVLAAGALESRLDTETAMAAEPDDKTRLLSEG